MGLSGAGRQMSFSMDLPSGSSPAGLLPLPGRKWKGSHTRRFWTSRWLCRFNDRWAELMRVYRAPLSKGMGASLMASSTCWAAWAMVAASSWPKAAMRAQT